MSYKYYCTNCGRALSQEIVLYNMDVLLTGDEEADLQILKFRLSEDELRGLYNSGKESDLGYRRCIVTLDRLMQWISNSNNLNNSVIAELSIEDIINYTETTIREATLKPRAKKDDVFGAMNDIEEVEQTLETEQPSEQKDEPLYRSAAITALLAEDEANKNKVYSEANLQKDLQMLSTRFVVTDPDTFEKREKAFVFDIYLVTEKDNNDLDVLTGYFFRSGLTNIAISEARVCPFCGDKIFEHAGTAVHRMITFIGDKKTGKTCTILALTHYAKNAMSMEAMPDDPIWNGAPYIKSIATVELLTTDERLRRDLVRYETGIVPAKTGAGKRLDAYSATFRIRNKGQSTYYLVTLIDLPGELCLEDGHIDRNVVLNEFPVALACDVFVLCFDSTAAVGGKANEMITKVCNWGNHFQELRTIFKAGEQGNVAARGKGQNGYAPIMVLFTKCPELESGADANDASILQSPLKRLYVFAAEKLRIDSNEVYKRVSDQMRQFVHLKDVYTASLRCSPYGFSAPKQEDVDEGNQTNLDKEGRVIAPSPIHIPELMRWLLSVAGCIPTDAEYRPNPSQVFKPDNNYILRPQYLTQIPNGKGRNGDVYEALSRCYLFEAPGTVDWEYVQYYDQDALLKVARIRARFKGNKKMI